MNKLFIGAHPDDIEISAMGYLLKSLKDGDKCHVIVLTSNSERLKECNNSFNLIKYNNFNYSIYNLPDTKLYLYEEEIRDIIESTIETLKIDKCITHFFKDTHRDHRTVSNATIDAARKISIICYESPNVYEFEPNLFIKLDKDILLYKIEHMKQHISQNIKNDNFYVKKIKANAEFRGQSIYAEYAEAYHILRTIE